MANITVNQNISFNKVPYKKPSCEPFSFAVKAHPSDSYVFANDKKENKKISFKEGVSLVAKGAFDKVINAFKAIVKNPVKTLATCAMSAGLISLAPLVGITSVSAASLLAVGFAGFAIFGVVKNSLKAINDCKDGKYDDARKDLQNLGGSSVDLAMSLPFLPKALKQVKRTAKYGLSSFGVNKQLLFDLKSAKSLDDVVVQFSKANIRINYDIITNEMGLKVKPELSFIQDTNLLHFSDAAVNGAAYHAPDGKILFNERLLSPKQVKTLSKTVRNRVKKMSFEEILRHELEHYRQYSNIVRCFGADKISQIYPKYKINTKFYSEVVNKEGAIPLNSEAGKIAQADFNNAKNYMKFDKKTMQDVCNRFGVDVNKINDKNYFEANKVAIGKVYKALHDMDPIEIPAINAQNVYLKSNIATPIFKIGSKTIALVRPSLKHILPIAIVRCAESDN